MTTATGINSLRVPFTCLMIAYSQVAQADPPGLDTEAASLKHAWKSEATNCLQSPAFAEERLRILARMLTRAPTNLVESEFARINTTVVTPYRTEALDYDEALLETLISQAVEQKNSERLVRLLRSNCPYAVGFQPIEVYLAKSWEDAIPLLCDAFREAKNRSAREGILRALSHAFSSLRAEFRKDEEFVEHGKRWFVENRRKLILNPNYPYFGQRPAFPEPHDRDLFLLRK